jgi:hypothetical protein
VSRVTRLLEQEEMVVRDLLDCGFWLELREHAREGSPAKYAIFNSDGV